LVKTAVYKDSETNSVNNNAGSFTDTFIISKVVKITRPKTDHPSQRRAGIETASTSPKTCPSIMQIVHRVNAKLDRNDKDLETEISFVRERTLVSNKFLSSNNNTIKISAET
jgi:hypothetical protein